MTTLVGEKADGSHEAYRARPYLPELDGVRGIALVLVISFHLQDPMGRWFSGHLGVTIFFVLSGYLITMLGLREERARGRVNIPAFFARRMFRLMPLYYLTLGIYCLYYFGAGGPTERGAAFARALPYYLSYLQEFALFGDMGTSKGVPFVHSWSLGIEEKYYLVWPFLAFLAWQGRGALRLWGTALLALLMAMSPQIMGGQVGRYFFPYFHILVGCVAALLLDDRGWFGRLSWLRAAPARWGLLALFLATHFCHRFVNQDYKTLHDIAYPIATALAMMSILLGGGWVARLLGRPALVKVGRLSYGIYLVHGLCLNAAEKIARPHTGNHLVSLATLTLAVAFAGIVAQALSIAIEKPCIELGRRISEALIARGGRREPERFPAQSSAMPEMSVVN